MAEVDCVNKSVCLHEHPGLHSRAQLPWHFASLCRNSEQRLRISLGWQPSSPRSDDAFPGATRGSDNLTGFDLDSVFLVNVLPRALAYVRSTPASRSSEWVEAVAAAASARMVAADKRCMRTVLLGVIRGLERSGSQRGWAATEQSFISTMHCTISRVKMHRVL
jgi:hypothetical protein